MEFKLGQARIIEFAGLLMKDARSARPVGDEAIDVLLLEWRQAGRDCIRQMLLLPGLVCGPDFARMGERGLHRCRDCRIGWRLGESLAEFIAGLWIAEAFEAAAPGTARRRNRAGSARARG